MIILFIIAILFACVLSVCVRVALMHPFKTVFYAARDTYKYFRYKKWNNLDTGFIIGYMGLFGKGKTLSVVHYVIALYFKFNDKRIYDFARKKWVTQKVNILSNVDLSIPHTHLESLGQIVEVSEKQKAIDDKNDTLTLTLVIGDEFSVQLNSRQFKDNIDPLFLNTLLTCRHHHITLVYDAQRFGHVDALLRQVTSYVVSCNKVWRFMVHEKYDAWEMENATSPTLIKPLARYGWFITDRDFEMYDTLACVSNLKKSVQKGDMLSQSEILESLALTPVNMEAVTHPSREYLKAQKKGQK